MKPADRAALTSELAQHTAAIAAELREKMLAPGPVRRAAQRLHEDEQVGDDFDVWTDLLSRRAAVLFVLKTVYVRVLEDRGAIHPVRIVDPESQGLFERLAPNLGDTAYLQWVFRDLAKEHGGLPELFAPQPAELGAPSDTTSRALLDLWRRVDPDTGIRAYRFDGERFDGDLMGDLYQDLDPVVKDRYALLQTPDFVREFMLDRTLTEAIDEHGADAVRLIDPACGSGHFLLEAFRRLVDATQAQHPGWSPRQVVDHVLPRIVGIDLNDYACALARARLVMLALELGVPGEGQLADAAGFHPQVYCADGLEQVERDPELPAQPGLFGDALEPPRASLTRPETRRVLKRVLEGGFEVVVANPPYITEKDKARKEYHRENVGGSRRYVSSSGKYSLASPFTERCFQLAAAAGRVGLITSNNFMKRTFGKALIEQVLADVDLTLVVDSSGAFIPGHGTPTVIFFGRNRAPVGERVRAVMGKRGEPSNPTDPRQGEVWQSIVEAWREAGFENEFISSTDIARDALNTHPWSLQGGGASRLMGSIESATDGRLDDIAESVGITSFTLQDDVFILPRRFAERLTSGGLRPMVLGESIRDYGVAANDPAIFPYSDSLQPWPEIPTGPLLNYMWRFRSLIASNKMFGSKTKVEAGLKWFEYGRMTASKLQTPLSIAFAFVATHNHFVLDRGGKVFNRSAPVIKLPPDATEDDHLALLGLLNSSVACFWMKQVFHPKGGSGVGRGIQPEAWMERYEHDSTKIQPFPIPANVDIAHARALDATAAERSANSIDAVLADQAWAEAATLRTYLDQRHAADLAHLRRMVALQEELDWYVYRLYGLDPGSAIVPDDVGPIDPTQRPMELLLARKDTEIRAALAKGESTYESPTVWFERHGWAPQTELSVDLPQDVRDLFEQRLERIAASKELQLLERPEFKRRWYKPDYAAEESAALQTWLTDRIEDALAAHTAPRTPSQLANTLQANPRFLAAAELYTGRNDFDLPALVATLMAPEAVPNHKLHLYKPKGLVKRAAWEKTWADQRREDAGEAITPKVPPKYTGADFLRSEHYKLRGKLDVPKERFIALTEVPQPPNAEPLYGWAGWPPTQRIRALLDLDEALEDQGTPVDDRIGLLDSAWRLLPDVERDDPAAAERARVELSAITGPDGPSPDALKRWVATHPPPSKSKKRRSKKR